MKIRRRPADRPSGFVRAPRRVPGPRTAEPVDATPMLVGWTMALVISFIATMAITNVMVLSDTSIAGVLTGFSALTRIGLMQLVRH